MGKVILLLLSLVCVYAFPAIKEESADEAVNDEFIENMYRKEIEEGDNAEEPLEPTKNTKHRNAKKKHLHGHFGAPFGHGFDSHGLGMDYPISHVHGIHGGIGHPIAHHGYGMHHGHDFHDPIGHPVVVSPGHGHELPIIFPHHDHHRHQHHHPHHMGYYHPEFMPMPYPMPMCVMEKDDKKEDKKDDKKKDDKKEKDKKTKRQLVPCHYYGPPGAGWGAFTPGHTGAGWGAPYWY